jgi:cellulose synthase/poly-beta-1,6-N-acetylglucosamine synthase-like glycosyltransferase
MAFFIVWFIVRPLLVLVFGLMKKKKIVQKSYHQGKGVSVVIPCHNEEKIIANTLLSVLKQEVTTDLEIIVVENNSTDQTFEVIQQLANKFPQIKPYSISIPRYKEDGTRINPISYAVNFGVKKAVFPIVLRLDGDTQLGEPHVLTKMIRPILNKEAVLSACTVGVENNNENIITRLQTIEYFLSMEVDRRAQQLIQTLMCASGAMQAFCKETFLAVGGYTDNIHVSEDMDLTLKMHRCGGVKLVEDAIVFTDVPNNPKLLMKQRIWWTYIGMICTYQHKKGLYNKEYGKFGLVGFIGLPLKIFLSFQAIIGLIMRGILTVSSVFSGATTDIFQTFIVVSLIHVALDAFSVLVCIPVAKNKQAVSSLWLIPIFTLIYGPLLNFVKLYAVISGIFKVNKERIMLQRKFMEHTDLKHAS